MVTEGKEQELRGQLETDMKGCLPGHAGGPAEVGICEYVASAVCMVM